jgi:uncharacterized iron-regulated protein
MFKLSFLFLILIIANINLFAERNYKIVNTSNGKEISIEDMAELSNKFDVIFFGEFHDDSLIHKLQMEYLDEFYDENEKFAVSLEMFERDVQSILNDFLSDKIDEDQFTKTSNPWPDYKKFYKPLVDFSKKNELYVLGANIPRKYAAMYARGGMSALISLPEDEKKLFAKELVLKNNQYQTNFFNTMLNSDTAAKMLSPNEENTLLLYYGAQCIKDETMAESILNYINQNPGYKVLHFNGDFHSNSYLGTAQMLKDRKPSLKIAVITPIYYEKESDIKINNDLKKLSDYVIFLQEPAREQSQMIMGGGGGVHLGENFVNAHNIEVKIYPESSYLIGVDSITFNNPILKSGSLKILSSLEVNEVSCPDCKIKMSIKVVDKNYNEIFIENETYNNQSYGSQNIKEIKNITIKYQGKVNFPPSETNLIQRHSNSAGIISGKDNEGLYLPGRSWYPQADKDLANFKVKVEIPKDYTLVTSGIITKGTNDKNNIFNIKTEFAIDDLTLVGGKYKTLTKKYDSVDFYAFTFDSSKFAETYLDASIEYYKLYTGLFGTYPFKTFSIVENFFATGFGMPGYTLLSNKLLAMPWVTLSPGSLAHEFVHNWWGNGVFTEYDRGNWCEALTTFSANYYYNVLVNKNADAIDWRKKSLISIDALPPEKNYPVADFKYQSDNYDAAIGYQKGGFIFYEVFKILGKDSFFNALKTFATKYKGKRAYWSSLSSQFAEQAKKDSINLPIRKIINQWLDSKDIPELKLVSNKMEGDSIVVVISQTNKFIISVPILFSGDENSAKEYFMIKDSLTTIKYLPKFKINSIQIDPEYEVLRKLYNWEKPFSFNRTLNEKPLVVMPNSINGPGNKDFNASQGFVGLLKESGYNFESVEEKGLTDEQMNTSTLILLGNYKNNKFIKDAIDKSGTLKMDGDKFVFKGKTIETKDNIALMNIQHPYNPTKLCTVIYFENQENLDAFKRLFHYLSYSLVILNNSKPGRPIHQMEIFPKGFPQNEMKAELK